MSIDKKALKGPDTFVSTSDKVFAWIEKNLRAVGLIVGAVAVLSLGWIVFGYVQSSAEREASGALYGPRAELRKAEGAVREERAKKMTELAGLNGKDKKAAVKPELIRPADYAKDYAAAVEKIKVQIKQHAGTKSALVSAMNVSYFLLQQQQYAEAAEVLNLVTYNPGANDILAGFYLMHKGNVMTENAKYDEAAKVYQAVAESKGLTSFHPEALLKLGVALELKGDVDKAKLTYQRLGRDFPQSEASSNAQQYLRLLELKGKQG